MSGSVAAIVNHGKYMWPPPRGGLEIKWYAKPGIRVVCILSHLAGPLTVGIREGLLRWSRWVGSLHFPNMLEDHRSPAKHQCFRGPFPLR